jgi:hypothetical protein
VAFEVKAGQRLGLIAFDVEHKQVDLRRSYFVEHGGERPPLHLDLVVWLSTSPCALRGVRPIRFGRALGAMHERHEAGDRELDRLPLELGTDQCGLHDNGIRPFALAGLEQLRHGLDEHARPALDSFEVVGVALHVAVIGAGLDEEAASLRQIGLELAVKLEERRPRVPRRRKPFEKTPARTRSRPCVRLNDRVLEDRPDRRRKSHAWSSQ